MATGKDLDPGRLTVEELTKEFTTPQGPLVVLDQISFALEPGESLAVVGPSGSGKSTLLNVIGSLEPPSRGRVQLGDLEVTLLSGEALAAYRCRQVGFVFQEHHLLPQCTALENVQLPALATGAPADAQDRARELLDQVSLGDRAHHLPAQLSGGERQRVAVARALLHRPRVLLCDEPTGNLDQATGERVASLCLELATGVQAMVILVTHDPRLARRCDQQRELVDRHLRPLEG